MSDEVSALFSVSISVESILGLLLLFMWAQNSEIRAVAWWGSAHLLRAGSISLFDLYGQVNDLISIDFANVVLLTSFAATWTGTRLYAGRKLQLLLCAGGITWPLANQIPAFQQLIPLRSLLSAFIIAGYTWGAAAELWYCPNCQSVSCLPAIFLLFAHGALFLLRTPLIMLLPHPAGSERVFASIWLTVLSSEALLFTISIAFILMAMAKEGAAFIHKAATLLDPLTGVWNRRGLLVENERLFQQPRTQAPEVAVLLVDLDNFKSINDRFGHAFGDRVLQMFAATARSAVRGSDFVGRLGGEEFAVVLYGFADERAIAVAERIRNVFAEQAEVIEGEKVGATVSIGLALHDGSTMAFTELLWRADRALYRAKESGRNRVEWAAPDFYSRGKDGQLPLGAGLPAARNVA